ncbi:DUF6438 domain-containing protein [Croceimicrobium sp.]|uniref:DUF6438 domain-containing protein n=1 Tax=Croceimicrobium sp. TaxID=2828340 RepID=UPI003BA94ED0
MKRLFPIAIVLAGLTACSSSKALYKNMIMQNESWSFAWESKACMGTCAIYSAKLEGNTLSFQGIRNTKFVGDTLLENQNELNDDLASLLEYLKFNNLDSLYQTEGAMDGPHYVYHLECTAQNSIVDKKVSTLQNEPEKLLTLRKWLNRQLQKKGLL